jgi:hypothetical protein
MKQVRLTVETTVDGVAATIEVGKADIRKNPTTGAIETNITITNLKVHDQLGGNKVTGVITNYEGDPEELA